MDGTGRATSRLGALRTGVAGVAYVALAALEGADVLAAPELGDRAEVVRAHVDGHADALVLTTAAGLLSLACSVAFAAGLRERVRAAGAWATVGLVGALAGVALAALAQGAALVLALRHAHVDDDALTTLWDLSIDARTWAAPCSAVGLFGFGVALRRGGIGAPRHRVARVLGSVGLGVAAGLAGTACVALVRPGEGTRLAVLAAFTGAAAWTLAVGAVLLLAAVAPGRHGGAARVRQVLAVVLVAAAGVTGAALLALPAATPDVFSWGLAPRPVAALVGGCYLAAAVTFAVVVAAGARAARGPVVAACGFASSTTAVSVAHVDVFDLDRLQALAWFALFPTFAVLTAAVALAGSRTERRAGRAPGPAVLGPVPRTAVALVAVAAVAGAVALWVDPVGAGALLPTAVPPLGGRFLGCWLGLLATLAGWAATHPDVDGVRVPAVALVAFPAAVLAALARVGPDLSGGPEVAGCVAVAGVVLAVGATAWVATVRPRARTSG